MRAVFCLSIEKVECVSSWEVCGVSDRGESVFFSELAVGYIRLMNDDLEGFFPRLCVKFCERFLFTAVVTINRFASSEACKHGDEIFYSTYRRTKMF